MLSTNCQYLFNEMMDIVRAFNAEDCEVTHYFSYSGGKFYNSVGFGGKITDFCETFNPADDLEYKRYAKRYAKLAIYSALSEKFGDLPWGALTGIRPTKLAYAELAADRDFTPLFKKMRVSEENIRLVACVLDAQKAEYRAGGQSLYVSLPFCPTKCDYCSFVTAPITRTRQYVDDYITCIEKELAAAAPLLKNVRSVYVGGGTPFVLDESQLTRIYAALSPFLTDGCEYTAEAGRPDVFTDGKLALSKNWGVKRICVNPQTFSDETLRRIGRKHTSAQTLRAFEAARRYGFDINVDLIAGLEGERLSDFENSVRTAVSLSPENITVHALSLKAGASLKERVSRLDGEEAAGMVALSRAELYGAGYKPYYLYRQKYQAGGLENTGWCKDGKVCRYNVQTMEELGDNIAVGAGAITKRVFGGGEKIERYASPKDIPSYIAKCGEIIERRARLFGADFKQ